MLGTMRPLRRQGGDRLNGPGVMAILVLGSGLWATGMTAQSCTTQGRMTAQQRTEIGGAAYALAAAVAAGDGAKVRAGTVAQYAGDPEQTAYLVRTTADRIKGDQLAVTQLYVLDATARAAGDSAPAEFACALTGTVSETDFGISGLPSGRFAFAMIEANGPHPWLLAFLLEQEGGSWKMAGFYPHARTAAGHDGLWYWTTARQDVKANKPWLAWVLYGEAEDLLRPVSFVTSSNLDKLLTEQRLAAPEMLAAGITPQTPLAVEGSAGSVYRVTALGADSSSEDDALNLSLHIQVTGPTLAGDAATERNVAAARALLTAHPELREGFASVRVTADAPGEAPFVVQRSLSQVMAR